MLIQVSPTTARKIKKLSLTDDESYDSIVKRILKSKEISDNIHNATSKKHKKHRKK